MTNFLHRYLISSSQPPSDMDASSACAPSDAPRSGSRMTSRINIAHRTPNGGVTCKNKRNSSMFQHNDDDSILVRCCIIH